MGIHLQDGKVRIDCPECNHRQAVQKPSGQVYCDNCKMLIIYDTGYGWDQFLRFRKSAWLNPLVYRKVG